MDVASLQGELAKMSQQTFTVNVMPNMANFTAQLQGAIDAAFKNVKITLPGVTAAVAQAAAKAKSAESPASISATIPKIAGFGAGAGKGTTNLGQVPEIVGFGAAAKSAKDFATSVANVDHMLQKLSKGSSSVSGQVQADAKNMAQTMQEVGRAADEAATKVKKVIVGHGAKPSANMFLPDPSPPPPTPSAGYGGFSTWMGDLSDQQKRQAYWKAREKIDNRILPTGEAFGTRIGGRDLSKETAQMTAVGGAATSVGQQLSRASKGAADFGDSVLLAGKRYAAFLTATTGAFLVIQQFKEATQAVLEFDAAMVKLDQIMDQGAARNDEIRQNILGLSTSTGTSASEVTGIYTTLAQAGFQGKNLDKTAGVLAQVPLLPTFKDSAQATEGMIAALNQFKLTGDDAASVLDKLNELSNKYAVESSDLVTAIQKGGGAWAQLGGSMDEYLALFTTIRSTTRESAESIGTGLRTITTRMTRDETRDYLEGIGIATRDAKGDFVGIMPILQQLGTRWESYSEIQKSAISEQLGGYRQVSKIMPALANMDKYQEAYNTSLMSSGSVASDAEKGLESLSKQMDIMLAKYNELVQSLSKPIFEPFIKGLTTMGEAATQFLKAIEPMMPMLAQLGAGLALYGGSKLAMNMAGKAAGSQAITGFIGTSAMGLNATTMTPSERVAQRMQRYAAIDTSLQRGQTPQQAMLAGDVVGSHYAANNQTMGGRLSRMAMSPMGQLAALGGLQIAAGEIEKLGGAASKTTAKFIETAAMLVTVGSMMRGMSIGQFMKSGNFFGMAGGAGIDAATGAATGIGTAGAVGAGVALALPLIASAVDSAMEDRLNSMVDEAVSSIAQMDTGDIGEAWGLNRAVDRINAEMEKVFAFESFDYRDFKGGVGAILGDFLDQSYDGIASILRGDGVDGAAKEEAQKIRDNFRKIFQANAKASNELLIQASMEGSDVRGSLMKRFLPESRQPGRSEELATGIASAKVQALLEAVGEGGLREAGRQSEQRLKAKQFNDAVQAANVEFAKLFIPPDLPAQLLALGDAVKTTVGVMTGSANTVKYGTEAAGRVAAPNIVAPGLDVIRNSIQNGTIPQELMKTGLSRVSDNAREMILGQEFGRRFTASISETEARRQELQRNAALGDEAANRELLGTPAPSTREGRQVVFESVLSQMEKDLGTKVSDAMKQQLEPLAAKWAERTLGTGESTTLPPTMEEIGKDLAEALPQAANAAKVTEDALMSLAHAVAEAQQAVSQAQARRTEIEPTTFRTTGEAIQNAVLQAGEIRQSRIGKGLDISPASSVEGFGGADRWTTYFNELGARMGKVSDSKPGEDRDVISEYLSKNSDVEQQLVQAYQESTATRAELQQRMNTLTAQAGGDKGIDLKAYQETADALMKVSAESNQLRIVIDYLQQAYRNQIQVINQDKNKKLAELSEKMPQRPGEDPEAYRKRIEDERKRIEAQAMREQRNLESRAAGLNETKLFDIDVYMQAGQLYMESSQLFSQAVRDWVSSLSSGAFAQELSKGGAVQGMPTDAQVAQGQARAEYAAGLRKFSTKSEKEAEQISSMKDYEREAVVKRSLGGFAPNQIAAEFDAMAKKLYPQTETRAGAYGIPYTVTSDKAVSYGGLGGSEQDRVATEVMRLLQQKAGETFTSDQKMAILNQAALGNTRAIGPEMYTSDALRYARENQNRIAADAGVNLQVAPPPGVQGQVTPYSTLLPQQLPPGTTTMEDLMSMPDANEIDGADQAISNWSDTVRQADEAMSNFLGTMGSAPNMWEQINAQTQEGSGVNDGSSRRDAESGDKFETLTTNLSAVADKVAQLTEQVGGSLSGLADKLQPKAEDATLASREQTPSTEDAAAGGGVAEGLREAAQSIAQSVEKVGEGLDVNLDAVSKVDVNVNMDESVASLMPKFEEAARAVANEVVSQALRQLAAASKNDDVSAAAAEVGEGLG